ncbi:MAG: alpha/beta hydrolase [Coriobacteriales bacterium]|nr:alpha/beta hydrolase [Coriobacteriales bacterium]
MRYAIVCCVFLAVCLLAGWLITRGLARWRRARWSRPRKAALSELFACVLLCAGTFCYLSVYYHADDVALDALESDTTVHVDAVEGGYHFDGPGTQATLVFLPGAKVQATAYAPLMHRMAAQGADCYLVDPPCNFPLFGASQARKMMVKSSSPALLVGGHSLGGVVATSLVGSSNGQVDGIVLLASIPTKELDDGVALFSAVGTNDGVLNRDSYEKSKDLWPTRSTELLIEGGNHAGFGCYGPQRGDGDPTIDAAEQQRQTADGLASFVEQIVLASK